MTRIANLHSRSVLAGYDPARLQAGKILVVGLGALGQNLVQNLALLGVGQLMLVDYDIFEEHNATRSPFYPTHEEVKRHGRRKATIVAHRAAQSSTASEPRVYYSTDMIQVLGDGALSWADIVVAAVDSLNARAWLAERCRLLSRPMIEGGFSGPDFNLAAFAATDGAACYRCGHPARESSMSCTAYAIEAKKAQIVPAIQTSAAVLGGYQAEQVVQLLHGRLERVGYRSYGNVRRETLQLAQLTTDERCPGIHDPEPEIATVQDLGSRPTLSNLLTAISQQFGGGRIRLAEPAIPRMSCTSCRTPCLVQATESSWLANPRCSNCNGPWSVTNTCAPDRVTDIGTEDELSQDLASTLLHNLGLRAGAALVTRLRDGRSGLLKIEGDILTSVKRAVPLDTAALVL